MSEKMISAVLVGSRLLTRFGAVSLALPGYRYWLLLAAGLEAIFAHHPSDPLFAHVQQHGQLAMAERIIDLMPLLDSDCDLFVLDRLFRAQVQAPTRQAEGTRDLAFGIGAVGYAKVMGQLHQLRGSYFPANSREAFFR